MGTQRIFLALFVLFITSMFAPSNAFAFGKKRVAVLLGSDAGKPEVLKLFLGHRYNEIKIFDEALPSLNYVKQRSNDNQTIVDYYILGHALPSGYGGASDSVFTSDIVNAGVFKDLRMVYMIGCNTATRLDDPRILNRTGDFAEYDYTWIAENTANKDSTIETFHKRGAQVVLGTPNFTLALDFYVFVTQLAQGKSVGQAEADTNQFFYNLAFLGNFQKVQNIVKQVAQTELIAPMISMAPWHGQITLNRDTVDRYLKKKVIGSNWIKI